MHGICMNNKHSGSNSLEVKPKSFLVPPGSTKPVLPPLKRPLVMRLIQRHSQRALLKRLLRTRTAVCQVSPAYPGRNNKSCVKKEVHFGNSVTSVCKPDWPGTHALCLVTIRLKGDKKQLEFTFHG